MMYHVRTMSATGEYWMHNNVGYIWEENQTVLLGWLIVSQKLEYSCLIHMMLKPLIVCSFKHCLANGYHVKTRITSSSDMISVGVTDVLVIYITPCLFSINCVGIWALLKEHRKFNLRKKWQAELKLMFTAPRLLRVCVMMRFNCECFTYFS